MAVAGIGLQFCATGAAMQGLSSPTWSSALRLCAAVSTRCPYVVAVAGVTCTMVGSVGVVRAVFPSPLSYAQAPTWVCSEATKLDAPPPPPQLRIQFFSPKNKHKKGGHFKQCMLGCPPTRGTNLDGCTMIGTTSENASCQGNAIWPGQPHHCLKQVEKKTPPQCECVVWDYVVSLL